MSQSTNSGGIGIVGALGVLFVGLKLGGVIDWSWWWVTAPFWGPVALVAVILAAVGLVWLVAQYRRSRRVHRLRGSRP